LIRIITINTLTIAARGLAKKVIRTGKRGFADCIFAEQKEIRNRAVF
jgi:hypothetical protein